VRIEPEKTLAEHIFSVVCQSAPWLGKAVHKAKSAVSEVIQIDACMNGTYSGPSQTADQHNAQTKLFARRMQAKGLQDQNISGNQTDDNYRLNPLWVLTGSCEPLGCVQTTTNNKNASIPMGTAVMSQKLDANLLNHKSVEITPNKMKSGNGHDNPSRSKKQEVKSPTSAIIYELDDADNDTHALAVAEAMADALRAEQISTSSRSNKSKMNATNGVHAEISDPLGTAFFNPISALSSGILDSTDKKIHTHPAVTDDDASQGKPPPVDAIELGSQRVIDFQRSVSELTMKSSLAQAISPISQIRRMAYYAVGKHVHNTDLDQRRGGNRRCYFTGKLILGGKPFYAGKLDQGLKTLVVFCLPGALGLPTMKELKMAGASAAALKHIDNAMLVTKSKSKNGRTPGENASEQDALSDVSTDLILQALPRPSQKLLNKMERKYPGPYNALPIIVRKPECWGLFSKFCFFSGLPIADGEMYFQVREDVAKLIPQRSFYGIEHIILCYEVLETANGAQSAEILKLPSTKTFKYLQKHYAQQCSKLHTDVFDRNSWETIMPEI
jgi:hypothetical protein